MKQFRKYESISQVLKDCNIFFSVRGEEWHNSSDIISFDDQNIDIEPYTAFLRGNNIFSMGSFSYTWSQLPITTRIGRYCSIASGVGILGTRHPIEWVTSSSSTYCIARRLHCLNGPSES